MVTVIITTIAIVIIMIHIICVNFIFKITLLIMDIITSIITIISINFIIISFPESDVKDTGAKLITPFQRSVLQE